MNGTLDHQVHPVWRRLDGELATSTARLLTDLGGLDGASVLARLGDVACVLVDASGDVCGASLVSDARVPLVGMRRFWVCRLLLRAGAPDDGSLEMIGATRDELARDFDPHIGGPVGLCVVVEDTDFMRRHPEAVWPENGLLFAGYTLDGRQVRLAYFDGAVI